VEPCTQGFAIVPCETFCGDEICSGTETCANCPDDCSNGICDGVENCSTCSDCYGKSFNIVRTSGKIDSYSTANGTEAPSPSSGLRAWIASIYSDPTIRNYDSSVLDRFFAHTFTGLNGLQSVYPFDAVYLCGGSLRARMNVSPQSAGNDFLGLPFVNSSGIPLSGFWGSSLTSLGATADNTITVNLFQANTSSVTTLLEIAQRRYLDVYVQDDTMLDYLTLTLQYCCAVP
jgi:hypothetical protein